MGGWTCFYELLAGDGAVCLFIRNIVDCSQAGTSEHLVYFLCIPLVTSHGGLIV